jgi:orotate phosphoribosyltransferase
LALVEWKESLVEFIVMRSGLLFGEFTLKSGRKSPYFFNLANLINDGEGLQRVSEAFALTIQESIGVDNFDYIQGPAYKGIPLAGAIAMLLHQKYEANKRWGYDRKESKEHGVSSEAWLVGALNEGDRIIIVDDVITTGLTKIKNIEKLEKYSNKSLEFEGIVIFLDRQEKDSKENDPVAFLEEQGLKVYSILKIRQIVEYLKGSLIDNGRYRLFQEYFKEYGT